MSPEFLITSFIVVLAPGTGVLYTIVSGLSRGRASSVAAAFGCTLGILPHLLASIIGLATLLHTSALLFQGVKYAGVAYLLYLAWKTLQDKGSLSFTNQEPSRKSVISTIVTGFAINCLNPKLSIFFLAFLPQFVPINSPSPTGMMAGLGAIFMVMTFAVFILYGVFAAQLRHQITSRPNVLAWFRRGVAGAFTALGTKLAFTDQ
ncbi:LysE family translocator [Sneathiella aquimaris]|uniref:LysE family translocator n=1 Tax=Sneathiella aquimaris TaxID=2599305 RepID=UPI00146D2491|nr:LysE family translocator [Sneathiella aquimaris]